MIRLSVVIITLNEERNIERCLQSVKAIADEVVVADSFSTDRTKEICLSHGVKFFESKWMGYAAQKNFAQQQCSNDCVLSLDADEALSEELADSIAKIKNDGSIHLYKFNRLTNYCGQWIRHGDWYPDRKLRIYDRRTAHWEGTIHEHLVHPPSEKIGLLKGDCFHYSYYSISDHVKQMENFTTLVASQAFEKKKQSNIFLILFSPIYKFCKSYFFRLGFLDGYYGFVISRISSPGNFFEIHQAAGTFQNPEFICVKTPNPQRLIISRTDAIGDVVLTLPVAGLLKKQFPGCKIVFFGRGYTKPVINACEHIDEFINYDDFSGLANSQQAKFFADVNADAIIHVFPRRDIAEAAKTAKIKQRIGTTNRLYHWWTCNRLIASGRKNSNLHESQLNVKLLKPFGIQDSLQLTELKKHVGLTQTKPLPSTLQELLSKEKFNLLLHPKSNISAREWSLDHYRQLIQLLPPDQFNMVITGTEKEKALMKDWLATLPAHVHDSTGSMTLDELISFIKLADGLIAASTGPLHLAGALGKHALGIYPPIRPMHPGRWSPIGEHAEFLVANKTCSDCRSNPAECHCMNEIEARQVVERVMRWKKPL